MRGNWEVTPKHLYISSPQISFLQKVSFIYFMMFLKKRQKHEMLLASRAGDQPMISRGASECITEFCWQHWVIRKKQKEKVWLASKWKALQKVLWMIFPEWVKRCSDETEVKWFHPSILWVEYSADVSVKMKNKVLRLRSILLQVWISYKGNISNKIEKKNRRCTPGKSLKKRNKWGKRSQRFCAHQINTSWVSGGCVFV